MGRISTSPMPRTLPGVSGPRGEFPHTGFNYRERPRLRRPEPPGPEGAFDLTRNTVSFRSWRREGRTQVSRLLAGQGILIVGAVGDLVSRRLGSLAGRTGERGTLHRLRSQIIKGLNPALPSG